MSCPQSLSVSAVTPQVTPVNFLCSRFSSHTVTILLCNMLSCPSRPRLVSSVSSLSRLVRLVSSCLCFDYSEFSLTSVTEPECLLCDVISFSPPSFRHFFPFNLPFNFRPFFPLRVPSESDLILFLRNSPDQTHGTRPQPAGAGRGRS